MTAPTSSQQPAPAGRAPSAAQLAALLALIQAQADVRLRLTQTAVAAVLAAFDNLHDWWNPTAINKAIGQALRIVQPTQAQAARVTDAYMVRAMNLLTGQTYSPVGGIDVTRLRRAMPSQVAHDLVAGRRKPTFLVIGDTGTGAGSSINHPAPLTLRDLPRKDIAYADPADPYGRVADQYRYDVVARGVPEPEAKKRAMVRLQVVAQTDVTLAVREMYEQGLKRKEVRGWRRIVHPEASKTGPCGLCVVAADRVYAREDLMPIHDRCCCEVLPVVVRNGQEYDPGYQLDRQQLDALYAEAGGTGGNPLRQAGHLKDVKVAIAEHAELGAVLVDANQNFRGPVDVARRQVKAKDPVDALAHQLGIWEGRYAELVVRAAQGEDLTRPMDFQRNRIRELRKELHLPEPTF